MVLALPLCVTTHRGLLLRLPGALGSTLVRAGHRGGTASGVTGARMVTGVPGSQWL